MKKIKLLYITQSYGGVETYIRQIVERLDYSKFELCVIGPPNNTFEVFCKQHNVMFCLVNMSRSVNLIGDLKAYVKIKKHIKKQQPDIIHTHSSKAGVIGRIASSRLKKQHVFTPNGISYLSFSGLRRSVFIAIESITRKYTDRVLASSYSEAIRLEFEIGIPKKDIAYIPNSIDVSNISYEEKSFCEHSQVIHIGSIARLTQQKNPLLFVEVAKLVSSKYNNVQFSILGTGLTDQLKEKTIGLINEYNLNDKFKILGWGDKSKSINYLKSLDIFILPSLFEGLPFSLLEAMSYGKIAITSKCDGCNDVIQHGENGFACMTAEQYVDIIDRLIFDQVLQQKIRSNAFEYVKKYHDINLFIKELEAYYIQTCRI